MEHLLWDVEASGLLKEADRLHSIQVGSLDGDDVEVYADFPGYRPLREGLERIKNAQKLYGFNSIGYDFPLIEKLYPGTLTLDQQVDLMLLAAMHDPGEKATKLSDHGKRLGILKGEFTGPWDVCTQDMLTYAALDIPVTRAVWKLVKHVMEWGSCVEVEHRFAWVLHLQQQNGFTLDIPAAVALEADLRQEVVEETLKARDVFPPRWVPAREKGRNVEVELKVRRPGSLVGSRYTKVHLEVFNPGSRPQVGSRLRALGWKPKVFGDNGHPKVDEKVLSTLPYPQAKKLMRLFRLMKLLGMLSDGKTGWLRLVHSDGRLRGRVKATGTAPGRCSHSKPNLAQADKKEPRMRACLIPRAGWKLVGIDGEGLQARLLASYLTRWDGGAYADKIVNGSKADKTDEHSSNILHIPYIKEGFVFEGKRFQTVRDGVKQCLYAVLFGAQDPSLGQYVQDALKDVGLPRAALPNRELGALARQGLFRAIKGFSKFEEALVEAIKKGYLKGPDGRRVPIRSRHSKLVFLMQAGESAVMKLAAVIFHFTRAPEAGLVHGRDFAYCAHVHDEHQLEARPELAELVGKTYAACIVEAGRLLKLSCPLAGSYDIGDNWSSTH